MKRSSTLRQVAAAARERERHLRENLAAAELTLTARDLAAIDARMGEIYTGTFVHRGDRLEALSAEAVIAPADYALARLGYDAPEIDKIRVARAAEAASKVTLA